MDRPGLETAYRFSVKVRSRLAEGLRCNAYHRPAGVEHRYIVLYCLHVLKAIPAGRLTVKDGPNAGIVLYILQMHPVFGHLSVCLSLRVFPGVCFGIRLATCQREAPALRPGY